MLLGYSDKEPAVITKTTRLRQIMNDELDIHAILVCYQDKVCAKKAITRMLPADARDWRCCGWQASAH